MNATYLLQDRLDRSGATGGVMFEDCMFDNRVLDRMSAGLAATLRDRGLGRGDRVVVFMTNAPEVIACFLACWRRGAVIVPLAPQLTSREVGSVLQDCGPRLVFASTETAVVAAQAAAFCEMNLPIEILPAGGFGIPSRHMAADGIVDVAASEVALILYTSGTTGRSKGVLLTHDNLLSGCRMVHSVNREHEGARGLLVLPLSHIFGILMMNLGFLMGSTSIVLRRWETGAVLKALQAERIEQLSVVPTMLTYLLNAAALPAADLSRLDTVSCGGAVLPDHLASVFAERVGCRVIQGYGLSETGGVATGYGAREQYRPGSVGRAWPGTEIAILDSLGRALAPGVVGEVCVRGPQVMMGYLNRPEESAQALSEGWLRTGDIGQVDDQGDLRITDRKKDLIIKGGENISPHEIEAALGYHDAVDTVVVFGVPDPTFGERVVAAVVLRDGATTSMQNLLRHLDDRLMRFKFPADIVFVDGLPQTASGKISRQRVRQDYIDSRS